jgi:hypothetical protein
MSPNGEARTLRRAPTTVIFGAGLAAGGGVSLELISACDPNPVAQFGLSEALETAEMPFPIFVERWAFDVGSETTPSGSS